MCLPSAPKAPPPIAPEPLPKAPTPTDPAVSAAKKRSRSVAALAIGAASTRQEGGLTGGATNSTRKTLLGTAAIT